MPACKQCQTQFDIRDADRAFYAKIDVPAPTRCPDCRQQRRMSWRNERVLYSRTCDSCKKNIVSIYSPDKPYTVYCSACWWKDAWSGVEHGREFDFSRPFFEQFRELQLKVPRIALYGKENENSDYTNHTDHAKNSYMSVDVGLSENILYSQWVIRCKDLVDSYQMYNAELCYENVYNDASFHSVCAFFADSSHDCYFTYQSPGSSNCFLVANHRHGEYLWAGEKLSSKEWEGRLTQLDLGSYRMFSAYYDKWRELMAGALRKHAEMIQTENCTGDYMYKAKNLRDCFDVVEAEDCAYCYECMQLKDSYDAYESGFNCELQYETHACNRTNRSQFCSVCYDGSYLTYCDLCHNSNNLFGCVGLKKNEFCILDKQYSQAEYEALRAKIIEHMKKTGEWGEFFPATLSPFGYNETVAPYHYPLSEKEATQRGFIWYPGAAVGSTGKTTLPPSAIPDHIRDAPSGITKEILECIQCAKNYKVIVQELAFYKKMNLPVPRLCADCRYRRRLSLRNPRRLYHRQCMCDYQVHQNLGKHKHHESGRCPNEFETTYAPEQKEIVYCQRCYKAEVV